VKGLWSVTARAAALLLSVAASPATAQHISFKHELTAPEQHCLSQLLTRGDWRYVPQFHKKMRSVAMVARAHLSMNNREQYIYIMHEFGFCGTAGCSMLIGEERHNGTCQQLYDGSGFTHAIAVLRKRDHGYRRLYTPCELRFDGHEYQQIHEECPTIDVQR